MKIASGRIRHVRKLMDSEPVPRVTESESGSGLGACRTWLCRVFRLSYIRSSNEFLSRSNVATTSHHSPLLQADSYLFDVRLLFASPSLLATMERTAPTASARPRLRRPDSCCSCCTSRPPMAWVWFSRWESIWNRLCLKFRNIHLLVFWRIVKRW